MQEELMLRLYNHVYADPVYWNNLGVEDRIFQLASANAVVEPDAVFCGSTAALLYGIGSAYTLLDKVQVLLPRSTRRDTYEFVEYKRWRAGEVWRLGLFTLTDPCRTVVDIARTSAFRYALGYVDGLAREYDVEREELRAYAQANCRGLHGIARAFDVFEYMDGRSDNGGESEARAAMILAGVAAPELQVEITRPGNAGYYLADYGWQMPDGSWTLAELHGLDDIIEVKRERPPRLVLVDAADMALPVGAIRLLDKRDVARKSMFTTHSLPLSILIEEIEQSCDDIVFVGIQPGDTEFYNPMSPEVFDAVDAVYDAVAANDFSHFVRLGQEQ